MHQTPPASLHHPSCRVFDDEPEGPDWRDLALIAAVILGLLFALTFTGCTVSGQTYGATKQAVADANAHAAPPGLSGTGDNAPALWQLACDLAADLAGWGAGAVVLGLAIASRAGCAGFGLNMALAGGVLLVAAFALPAYGGWALAGLAVLGGAALVGLWKTRDQSAAFVAPHLPDQVKSIWSRITSVFAPSI